MCDVSCCSHDCADSAAVSAAADGDVAAGNWLPRVSLAHSLECDPVAQRVESQRSAAHDCSQSTSGPVSDQWTMLCEPPPLALACRRAHRGMRDAQPTRSTASGNSPAHREQSERSGSDVGCDCKPDRTVDCGPNRITVTSDSTLRSTHQRRTCHLERLTLRLLGADSVKLNVTRI